VTEALLTGVNVLGLAVGVWVVPRRTRLREFVLALFLYLVVWLAVLAALAGRMATIRDSAQVLLSVAGASVLYLLLATLIWRRQTAE
jgi:hypothetical protein